MRSQSKSVFLSSLLLIFFSTSVLAQTAAQPSANTVAQAKGQASTLANSVSPTTGLLQIFLALIIVIALMLFIAWLFKRIGTINSMNKVPMKVVGGLSLGNRERIMVVEVGDQWLVLGITAQQISNLSSMPKQALSTASTDDNKLSNGQEKGPENQFAYWLKKTLEKRNTPDT
ncbi:flagellar biosynthetic protein FliO [Undibacterium danionis]|uniref:Flagellar protein n=1 Tax=Undibacterium danionis TaxID=1812100 RepID=A0ABV6I949_9BURK